MFDINAIINTSFNDYYRVRCLRHQIRVLLHQKLAYRKHTQATSCRCFTHAHLCHHKSCYLHAGPFSTHRARLYYWFFGNFCQRHVAAKRARALRAICSSINSCACVVRLYVLVYMRANIKLLTYSTKMCVQKASASGVFTDLGCQLWARVLCCVRFIGKFYVNITLNWNYCACIHSGGQVICEHIAFNGQSRIQPVV